MRRQTSGVAAVTPATEDHERKKTNQAETAIGFRSFRSNCDFLAAKNREETALRSPFSVFNENSMSGDQVKPNKSFTFKDWYNNLPPSRPIATSPLPVHNKPIATEYGFHTTISAGYRIDISSGDAIRIYSLEFGCVAAINIADGTAAISHQQARLLLEDGNIEIWTSQRQAKISSKGISFKRINQPLCYYLDDAGCKTTTDKYQRLEADDYTSIILFKRVENGVKAKRIIQAAIEGRRHYINRMDDEIWLIAGYKITSKKNGELTICKFPNKMFISFDPLGTVKVKMDNYRMSVGYTHLNTAYIDEKNQSAEHSVRLRDGKLVITYGSQQAGLDKYGELFVK
ncbi:hypothetical protein HDE_06372 [Halotydeus destructor]|nr:hypothetical protein HDE_06372 [Halotydeus destructor]